MLTDLERRAENVRAKLLTAAEDKIADHQATPLTKHFDAYERHLRAAGTTEAHRKAYRRSLRRTAADCSFGRLSDLNAEALERWLTLREREGMSARSRNAYREAAVAFCNWCMAGPVFLSALSPVPEPSSMVLCLVGSAAIGLAHQIRRIRDTSRQRRSGTHTET